MLGSPFFVSHRTLNAASQTACALLMMGIGCGHPAPERPEPTTPSVLGNLLDHVPGSPDLIVVARPAELLETPATRAIVDVIVDEPGRQNLYDRSGVDVTAVSELVYVDYGDRRSLRLARMPSGPAIVVANARDLQIQTSTDGVITRRSGHDGIRHRELVAVDGVVMMGHEVGTQIATVLDGVREARLPPPPEGDWAALRARFVDAPLVFFAPDPLGLPPEGIGLLLARERALAVAVRPRDETSIEVVVAMRGEMPDGIEENLRTWITSMAGADLGRALGLGEALHSLEVDRIPEGVELRLDWPVVPLVRGLRLLFHDDIRAIVE